MYILSVIALHFHSFQNREYRISEYIAGVLLVMPPAAVNYPTITSPVTMVTPSAQNSDITLAMTLYLSTTKNLSAFMKDIKVHVCNKQYLYYT